jgi:hypothetical protein
MLEALAAAARQEKERRLRSDPSLYFPWHRIQTWVLDAPNLASSPVRIILAAGGNRAGKSATAKGIWSGVVNRTSPLSKQFTTLDLLTGQPRSKGDLDPLTSWVVPPTLEKARADWIAPQDRLGLQFWAGKSFLDHREQPDNIVYTKTPGLDPWTEDKRGQKAIDDTRCDKTLIKSQDQGLLTFESSAVDLVLVDEEIEDEAKWNSMLLRVGTTNGVLVMAFTPLHGLTWSFDRYWKPLVKMGHAQMMGDRCWLHEPERGATVICVQMGCADNPLARKYSEEIAADPRMSEAEKNARLHGEYGFVEGTLIPALSGIDVETPLEDHAQYVVDVLPGQSLGRGKKAPGRIVGWYLLADPNKSCGGVLGALDQDDNLFLVSEHLEESLPNRLHAAAFKRMETEYATGPVERYADYGSAGAQAMIDFGDFGLSFTPIEKAAGSVSASVKALRGRAWVDPKHAHPITGKMGAPRIYFYRPGMVTEHTSDGETVRSCRTAEQISMARQTSNDSAPMDTPHKDTRSKLDLFDCVRYMCMVVARVPEDDGEGRRGKTSRTNHLSLPSTLTPDSDSGTFAGLDTPFYLPEYNI